MKQTENMKTYTV